MAAASTTSGSWWDYLGSELCVKGSGGTVERKPTAAVVAGADFIILYFSASYCGPCRWVGYPRVADFDSGCCPVDRFGLVKAGRQNVGAATLTRSKFTPLMEVCYEDMPPGADGKKPAEVSYLEVRRMLSLPSKGALPLRDFPRCRSSR
jgi:thiol-disulfide isomerase/thioredoxin